MGNGLPDQLSFSVKGIRVFTRVAIEALAQCHKALCPNCSSEEEEEICAKYKTLFKINVQNGSLLLKPY